MVAAVEKATENFIEKGELIAYENPDIKQEMLSAVEEVRKTGCYNIISFTTITMMNKVMLLIHPICWKKPDWQLCYFWLCNC